MADFILQATLSNLLVSAILAAIAWFIQKRYRAASLANLLWIMVLIKMITPPLFAIPLLEVGAIAVHNPVALPAVAELEDHLVANTTTDGRPVPGKHGRHSRPGLAAGPGLRLGVDQCAVARDFAAASDPVSLLLAAPAFTGDRGLVETGAPGG